MREILTTAQRIERSLFERFGHTWTDFRVLDGLVEAGGQGRVGQISDFIKLNRASMTFTTDKLVARKLIIRERSDDDRRAVVVTIMTEGRALHGRMADYLDSAAAPDAVREYLDSLTKQALSQAG